MIKNKIESITIADFFYDKPDLRWIPLPEHTLEQSPCYPIIGVTKLTNEVYEELPDGVEVVKRSRKYEYYKWVTMIQGRIADLSLDFMEHIIEEHVEKSSGRYNPECREDRTHEHQTFNSLSN